jgi:hypothetical protein
MIFVDQSHPTNAEMEGQVRNFGPWGSTPVTPESQGAENRLEGQNARFGRPLA